MSRETARATKEPEAQAVLYEMAAQFSRAGASTSVQLHFGSPGPEEAVLQDRIATETDADAVLVAGHITMRNNVLIPLRDDRRRDDIVEFLTGFDEDSIFVLELYHAAVDQESATAATEMLESVEDYLLDHGFEPNDVEVTVEVRDDAAQAIADCAQRHNLVVMGETEEVDPDSAFLGPVYRDIADQTDTPIVVVRK